MAKKPSVTSIIKASIDEGLSYKDIKKSLGALVSVGVLKPTDERVDTSRAFELRRQGMTWENIAKDQHLRKTNIESATKFHYPFLVERKRSANVLQRIQQNTMKAYGLETVQEYNEYMDTAY